MTLAYYNDQRCCLHQVNKKCRPWIIWNYVILRQLFTCLELSVFWLNLDKHRKMPSSDTCVDKFVFSVSWIYVNSETPSFPSLIPLTILFFCTSNFPVTRWEYCPGECVTTASIRNLGTVPGCPLRILWYLLVPRRARRKTRWRT